MSARPLLRPSTLVPSRRLAFTVKSDPVAMPRPRVTVRGGRPHGYVPAHAVQAMWEITPGGPLGKRDPLSGPLSVMVTVYVRPPASIPERDRLMALPTKRPCLDNYAKTALDGRSPLWCDGPEVAGLVAHKRYTVSESPQSGMEVETRG